MPHSRRGAAVAACRRACCCFSRPRTVQLEVRLEHSFRGISGVFTFFSSSLCVFIILLIFLRSTQSDILASLVLYFPNVV